MFAVDFVNSRFELAKFNNLEQAKEFARMATIWAAVDRIAVYRVGINFIFDKPIFEI